MNDYNLQLPVEVFLNASCLPIKLNGTTFQINKFNIRDFCKIHTRTKRKHLREAF